MVCLDVFVVGKCIDQNYNKPSACEKNMKTFKKRLIAALLLSVASVYSFADSNDPNEMALEYRNSVMTLVGQNFGPMVAMLKGQIPWDNASFAAYAKDLEMVTALNMQRGFREGSHVGKTKAKPSIWKSMADFEEKMQAMSAVTVALSKAAAAGEKGAIVKAFRETGGTCKGCHDDYKSKEYLNQ